MLSPMCRSSKYSCGLLEKVPRAPIIIGVILTLRNPQSLFISKARSIYFSSFSCSFRHIRLSSGKATSTMWHLFVFLSITRMSGLLCGIFRSVWMVKSQRILTLSFSRTHFGACSNHFPPLLNSYRRNRSQFRAFATVSCLRLYCVCAILGHSLTI